MIDVINRKKKGGDMKYSGDLVTFSSLHLCYYYVPFISLFFRLALTHKANTF